MSGAARSADTDDTTLLRRMASGDRSALATAFDRFAPVATRYVWAVVATPDAVAAVVQDAFVRLWDDAATTALPTGRLLPRVLATCRELTLSGRSGAEAPDPPVEDPLRWVRADVDALPDDDRRLCELCVLEGLSYADALARLGLGARAQGGDRR